jgi:hypothetical protein
MAELVAQEPVLLVSLWRLAVKGENTTANLLTRAVPGVLLCALEDDNEADNLPVRRASQWTDVPVASLRLPHWRRGGEQITDTEDFSKTRDCQPIAGFLFNRLPPGWAALKKGKNMNANYQRVPTEFAPEVRFEVTPVPPTPFRAWQDTELEHLKNRLLQERLEGIWAPRLRSSLLRAANDAAALAWMTPYPLLVFPVLFEEKARIAWQHTERQNEVRKRSRELLAA